MQRVSAEGEGLQGKQPGAESSLENDIAVLFEAAASNGHILSLGEIAELVSLSRAELQRTWNKSEYLNSKYVLSDELILEQELDSKEKANVIASKKKRHQRALSYIEYGRRFSTHFAFDKSVKLLSISGSTSYYSSAEHDDLDFFCITFDDNVWIFITKALLLARVFRLSNPDSPPLCFSYVLGESRASKIFATQRTGLMARDALSAIPLIGSEFYHDLLIRNSWVSKYFPVKYKRMLSSTNSTHERTFTRSVSPRAVRRGPALLRVLNMVLFVAVGNYISLKAFLLNRKFAKSDKTRKIFKTQVELDRHLFESLRYLELNRKYAKYGSNRDSK
jgi:hypothetical protein